MKRSLLLALLFVAGLHAQQITPPWRRSAESVTMFGDTRTDDYGWIRDKSSAEPSRISRQRTRTPTR